VKRIVKVNRHTAQPICRLSRTEFNNEAEVVALGKDKPSFANTGKTWFIETKNYTYLYLPQKETSWQKES